MDRRRYLQAVGISGTISLAGCLTNSSTADAPDVTGDTLTLATATTTHDSGLLDELLPGFQDRFGTQVDTVVRGTGGALQTARAGDCDVVIVHARPLEDEFLRTGAGINRRQVMVNDFVVVGPADDPANIAGEDPVTTFQRIAEAEVRFLSRGDRSGTHLRERQLWAEAGIDPSGSWYSETGQGMGNTLNLATQTEAYTLSDRGTFLNVIEDTLEAHVNYGIESPPALLRNEYAVIPVNPARHDVAYPLAMAFVGYLTGPAQTQISEFRIADKRAFRSLTPSQEPEFGQYIPSDWQTETNVTG
ncbi:ABC-type tungstate transport system, periplasmic binding protein [Halorubrum sp. DM2]|uniref:substrate-binding domain-containing protein n=1 Tax=unclassified Halorubrum TaxID=2642239 RepID=UPI0003DCA6FF|nr:MULTISPECIES: substrate-binding domain-containing protein [unclassified Halorubrum]CDK38756.1 putative signal peptide protein [Halorubrum sp. AJ67]VTT86157.1 ABC-type tungstate transport system, periplasmic binding protein [Halorubrum sp. DM2]